MIFCSIQKNIYIFESMITLLQPLHGIVLKGAPRLKAQLLSASLSKTCALLKRCALKTLISFLNTFILEISNNMLKFI